MTNKKKVHAYTEKLRKALFVRRIKIPKTNLPLTSTV